MPRKDKFIKKIINLFLDPYSTEFFLRNTIRKMTVIKEKYRILFNTHILKCKKVLLIYDCKVSPASYGDFMEVLLLARTLVGCNLKVDFIVINGEYRRAWYKRYKNEIGIDLYLDYLNYLLKKLSAKDSIRMFRMNWDEFKDYSSKNNEKKTFILFKKKINLRRPLYTHASNLVNYILHKNPKLQNMVLLKNKEFKEKLKKNKNMLFKKKYITIGCRCSPSSIGTERNLPRSLFVKLIKRLNKYYPEHKKVIISDNRGCKHFRKISKKYFLRCEFSKDYSYDFLGDGQIILNSDVYFQIRGGGMSSFAIYSQLPFLILDAFNKPSEHHLITWSELEKKEHTWLNSKQHYIHYPETYTKSSTNQIYFNMLRNFKSKVKI